MNFPFMSLLHLPESGKHGLRRLFKLRAAQLLTAVILCALSVSCAPQKAPAIPYERHTAGEREAAESRADGAVSPADADFDRLTEQVFQSLVTSDTITLHYTLKHPDAFGITPPAPTFGGFSSEQLKEAAADIDDLRARLQRFFGLTLTGGRDLTLKILDYYLKTEQSARGLELYAEPFSPTVGIQAQLPVLLAEYDFQSEKDVKDYLSLLSQYDTYFSQIMTFQREKADAGLFMSDWMADQVIESCRGYLTAPEDSILCSAFERRLEQLPLTEDEKKRFMDENTRILKEHVIPAYEETIRGLTALKGSGRNAGGLCHFPQGKEYYEYLVAARIGPSCGSVEQLREAVAQRLKKDLSAVRTAVAADPSLAEMVKNASFISPPPQEMLLSLKASSQEEFPALPDVSCSVRQVPASLQEVLSPAFYLTPAIDSYSDHTIYINPKYAASGLYPTMAHEGYPGHLYQNAWFFSQGRGPLRYVLSFSGYTEGWATYAEHISYGFENGLDPRCARLMAHNSLANLGLYALLDINVNYHGWDEKQTAAFLAGFGIDDAAAALEIFRSLAANPSNYLSYYAGCLEFLTMREEAESALGDRFSPVKFHRMLLDLGPAPFTVVRREFEQWLQKDLPPASRHR